MLRLGEVVSCRPVPGRRVSPGSARRPGDGLDHDGAGRTATGPVVDSYDLYLMQQPTQTLGCGRVKARQQVLRCTSSLPLRPGTSSIRSATSSAVRSWVMDSTDEPGSTSAERSTP